MSRAKSDITRRAIRAATPTYRLSNAQLDDVLTAMPPMIASAPLAWHQSRRQLVIGEIAALHPTDAVQACIAGQIVILRHLATSQMCWVSLHANSPGQEPLMGPTAAALMRAGEQAERALRQWQKAAVPSEGAGNGFDLLAMEATWRNNAVQPPAAKP